MEIRISIQTTTPLAGTAWTECEGPLPFEGWLELLQALAKLVEPRGYAAEEKLGASPEWLPEERKSDERTNDGDIDDGPTQK